MQRITSGDRWRVRAAVALLVFQVGMVGLARWHDDRFFTWAPHDEWTDFEIDASVAGRPLSDDEILRRYGYTAEGSEPRAGAHVLRAVRLAEERYHDDDPATVTIRYRVNGGEEQTWFWP